MEIAADPSHPATAQRRAPTGPPECWGWRAVVEEVLREAGDPVWEAMVPAPAAARVAGVPLLAGAAVTLRPGLLARVRGCWFDAETRCGTRLLDGATSRIDDETSARLFAASLDGDHESIEKAVQGTVPDLDQLESLAYLLPVPFLQACHRRLSPQLDASWDRGFCPLCGSWPAFAEVLGIERGRRLRCGRCGAAWYAQPLSCGFCGTPHHTDLVTLVPAAALAESGADSRRPDVGGSTSDRGVVEACTRCSGYIKRFTTLQGWPAAGVMLQDLASAALDLAAIEEGYTRPSGTGHPLHVRGILE